MNRTVERSSGYNSNSTVRPSDVYSYLLECCEKIVEFFERPAVSRSLRLVSGLAALVVGFFYACALVNGLLSLGGALCLGFLFVCLGIFAIRGKSGL